MSTTTATAPRPMMAWVPEWRANEGDDVRHAFSEAMHRHPAQAVVQVLAARLGGEDGERLMYAAYELMYAAYELGTGLAGAVTDLGEPGPENGYEPFLAELVRRASVPQVAGQVQADGLFHVAEDDSIIRAADGSFVHGGVSGWNR